MLGLATTLTHDVHENRAVAFYEVQEFLRGYDELTSCQVMQVDSSINHLFGILSELLQTW
jgi:hypothetical protein